MARSSNLDFAVIGLGRYGSVLARRLEALGYAVLGVDSDAKRVRAIADEITSAVIAEATDEDALQELDIGAFGTVIVAIGDDFGASAQIAASAKDMGVPNVIVRTDSDRDAEILRRIGVDEVVMPLQEAGEQLAAHLSMPGVLKTRALSGTYSVAELEAHDGLAGRAVGELEKRGITAVMLQRGDELTIAPAGDVVLREGDLVFVVGAQKTLADFMRTLQ